MLPEARACFASRLGLACRVLSVSAARANCSSTGQLVVNLLGVGQVVVSKLPLTW